MIIDIIRTQNDRTIVWSIGIYYILSIILDQLQTNINQIWLNNHFQFSGGLNFKLVSLDILETLGNLRTI